MGSSSLVMQVGFTALAEAARRGFVDIVKLLLEAGADPSLRTIVRSVYTSTDERQANVHACISRLS